MKSIIIAAVSKNNIIGKDGKIPWHSKEELRHFKDTTTGFPVIMGRKTFESIGKPLENRLNIVITAHPGLFIKFAEIKCFNSLKEALFFCENHYFGQVFIAGGARLYNEAILTADELIISRMNFECEGDTHFPGISSEKWSPGKTEKRNEFEILFYSKKE